jgi:hypothetical protein
MRFVFDRYIRDGAKIIGKYRFFLDNNKMYGNYRQDGIKSERREFD